MEVAKQRLAKAGFQFYELPDSEESDDDTWPLKEKRDHASDLVCVADPFEPKKGLLC
jgi:hypothetical protein